MKYFKDTNNTIYAYELDGSQDDYIKEGLIAITEQEADLIRNPTPVYTFEDIRHALQSAIDVKAQALGFSGGNALMLYAGFTNQFQSMASSFSIWEASVWVQAGEYKAQVILGNSPMLSPSEAVALMPTYP